MKGVIYIMDITSKNYTQPLFGDMKSPNNKGNNGYGYDEHEQYVKQDDNDQITHIESHQDDLLNVDIPVNYQETPEKSRICIVGGEYNDDIKSLARTRFIDYKGEVFYDNGEEMTDDNKRDMTALYFDNTNKNNTQAFIDEVKKQFPSANVFVTNILDETDDVNLDFSGLDNQNELYK